VGPLGPAVNTVIVALVEILSPTPVTVDNSYCPLFAYIAKLAEGANKNVAELETTM
jgi:hypothetical protein